MRKNILSILLFLAVFPLVGQIIINDQNNVNLAHSYFRNNEFDKAAPMFLELYEKTKASHYFDYYINCLVSLQRFDEAEKALKKVMRTDKNPINSISLGMVYKAKNDLKGADKIFNEIINGLAPNVGSIITIANTFFNRGEFELAERTYLKGREILPGELFRTYLATVYAYRRDYNKMMNEYLAMLAEDEKNLTNVQGRLGSLMRFDFDNTLRNLVKKEVLKSIQSTPDKIVYNRLLIWIFVQEEDFSQALNQAVALDRRTRTEEENILSFARSSANNGLYDVALSGINYLIDRKPVASNLDIAKQEKVAFEYLKLVSSPQAPEADHQKMELMFQAFFSEFGYSTRTAPLARDYAHYMAFFRHKPDTSYDILEKAMKSKEMDANQYTLLRIELADLNVYADYLWEASLQYAQIIESNKNNPLGDEVKLKKAKLSYYQGEIEWAKAQLDVLKASTSKLIANDAMELSLLITGNYELDTLTEPIGLFARADLYLFRNQSEQALAVLDSFVSIYAGHSLNDQVLMRKALISERAFRFKEAADYYSQIVENYSFSTSADDALFKLAQLNEQKLNNPDKAKEYYKLMLTSFPGSVYVADSRAKFREIRGDFPVNDPFDLLKDSNRPVFTE